MSGNWSPSTVFLSSKTLPETNYNTQVSQVTAEEAGDGCRDLSKLILFMNVELDISPMGV